MEGAAGGRRSLRYLFGMLILVAVAIPVTWVAWQLTYVWLPPDWAAFFGSWFLGFSMGVLLIDALWRHWRRTYGQQPPEILPPGRRERY